MVSKATRSQNAVEAVRASVTERARRGAGAGRTGQTTVRGGPKAKRPPAPSRSKPAPRPKTAATTPGRRKAPVEVGKGGRSTTVVLTRIHPVSVLKVSALFYLSLALALFIAGVLLWTAARSTGLIANIEGLLDDVGFTDFSLETGPLLAASALASMVLVVAGSSANLLMALLYNLIGDFIGGIKVVLTEHRGTTRK